MNYGYNYLRKSKVPIPAPVAGLFLGYSSIMARISYGAEQGVPGKLSFCVDLCLASRERSVLPVPVFSLEGILKSDRSAVGNCHGSIVKTAKVLLNDVAGITKILSAYHTSKQPQHVKAVLFQTAGL